MKKLSLLKFFQFIPVGAADGTDFPGILFQRVALMEWKIHLLAGIVFWLLRAGPEDLVASIDILDTPQESPV